MAQKIVKLWYDREGDYLEVMFDRKPGYFRETKSDQVMEKVDKDGNVLGFSILIELFHSNSKSPIDLLDGIGRFGVLFYRRKLNLDFRHFFWIKG